MPTSSDLEWMQAVARRWKLGERAFKTLVKEGDPPEEVQKAAEEIDADLLISVYQEAAGRPRQRAKQALIFLLGQELGDPEGGKAKPESVLEWVLQEPKK